MNSSTTATSARSERLRYPPESGSQPELFKLPSTRKPSRRARPAAAWSLQIASSVPMVREGLKSPAGAPIRARCAQQVADLCADLAPMAQEVFVALDLNAKNGVIDKRLVSLGVLDASLVHPREVFRGAVLAGAAAIIVAHNHPSGDPAPSAEDIRITRQLVQAGRVLGIRVLDHVVIGRANATAPGSLGFVSLRESGLVGFGDADEQPRT